MYSGGNISCESSEMWKVVFSCWGRKSWITFKVWKKKKAEVGGNRSKRSSTFLKDWIGIADRPMAADWAR